MSHSSGQQRGPYATTSCTNCRRRHTKCSEEATCTNFANIEQEHTFTLTEYQFITSIPSYLNYDQEPQQMQSEFSPNQICTDNNYIMPNSNTSINFSD
ncbi:30319_t:CDS:2, partial [Gigaspora margarita]